MSEKINIQTDVVENWSSKMDSDSLFKFIENSSSEAIKSKLDSDNWFSKLIKTYFKNTNEKALGEYSKYWINMKSLQQSFVNYKYDLWGAWVKKDWVDWSFWEDTFLAIINMQKILWQKQTWIIDLELLKYLFPYNLRAINQKEWRTPDQMYGFVNWRLSSYNWDLKKEKNSVVDESKIQIWELKQELKFSEFDWKSWDNKNESTNIKGRNRVKARIAEQNTWKEINWNNEQDNWIKKFEGENNGFTKIINSYLPKYELRVDENTGEKYRMSFCSETAQKNLFEKMWVNLQEVPSGDPIDAINKYAKEKNYAWSLSQLPDDSNVLDLFIKTNTRNWSKYGHRASAYLFKWIWMVLDPYYPMPWHNKIRTNPVPIDQYIAMMESKWRKVVWAYPHVSEIA